MKGFKLLQGWLASLKIEQVHACLEATGPYGEAVAEFLYEHGHRVSVVNPLRIKSFAQSDLQRNKTDQADARTIAAFCIAKDPDEWHPLPAEIKQLQALTRRADALGRMLIVETNRLEMAPKATRPSIERMVENLKQEIENVRHLIKDHIDDHPDLKQQSDLLQSIPGIGEKTARLLLGEIEFRSFESARALAAYAGVTPRRFQSGTSLNWTRLSKLGSSRIRAALYFPAITALQYNAVIKTFAMRLSESGKTPMQIVCAAMRKLLHIAFGVIKNNRPFDPTTALPV
ncbi:MAG TPA: IS110 family transposase [Pyrinomonadaceae bacterium]|nr:IS110 family transposase [Pyrinomonadaceae bacterium]